MKFIVYQITNLLNKKLYVGVHKTEDINDDYFGSGKIIRQAVEKYGKENFTKIILAEFDNEEEMFLLEREIVNEEFVARDDTYNLKVGGEGGWGFINSLPVTDSKRENISKGLSNAHHEGKLKQNFKFSMLGTEAHTKVSSKGGKAGGGHNRLTEEEIEVRKAMLKDVDFTKHGHISQVARILDVSHTHAKRFIMKYLSVLSAQ